MNLSDRYRLATKEQQDNFAALYKYRRYYVKKFFKRSTHKSELQDLMVDTLVTYGMLRAAYYYDPSKGASIHTFCHRCVMSVLNSYYINKVYKLDKKVKFVSGKSVQVLIKARENGKSKSSYQVEVRNQVNQEIEDIDTKIDCNKIVSKMVKCLSPRSQEIVNRYFGIGCEKKKLREIGAELGITKSRVGQCVANAIAYIRKHHRVDLTKVEEQLWPT